MQKPPVWRLFVFDTMSISDIILKQNSNYITGRLYLHIFNR